MTTVRSWLRRIMRLPNKQAKAEAKTIERDLAHLEETFDILSLTDDWLDEGMRGLFAGGAALYVLHTLQKTLVSTRPVASFGFGWNYIDAVGGIVSGINTLVHLGEVKGSISQKALPAVAEILGGLQLLLGTTLTILATYGVLTGAVASVASPLGAITFAVAMFVSACKEAFLLYRAVKKTSMPYLLEDRLTKYENLETKIDSLNANIDSIMAKGVLTREQTAKADSLKAQRTVLKAQQVVLKEQALAIASVHFRDKDNKLKAGAKKDINSILFNFPHRKFLNSSNIPLRDAKKVALVNFLKAKQEAKVRKHLFGVITWSLAATGTGLIAAGIFFPPLIVPGVVITAAAGGAKLIEMFDLDKRMYNAVVEKDFEKTIQMDNTLVNYLARRQERQEVYKNYETDYKRKNKDVFKEKNEEVLSKVPPWLDKETRIKMHIAYTLSKDRCEPNKIREEVFYQKIMKLSWWKRRGLLKSAINKHVDNLVSEDPEFVEKYSFVNALSEKDKKVVVSEHIRNRYSFFSKRSESTSTSEATTEQAGHKEVKPGDGAVVIGSNA